MSATLHVGLWQAAGIPGDVAANLAEVREAARSAAARGIEVLVFPECFLTGYFSLDPLPGIAAQVTPSVLADLADLAAGTGVTLVLGSYEARGGAIHNSAFVLTPADGHRGTYRKRALFGDWEREVFTPGSRPFLFDCKGFRIGLQICYDIEFPEQSRELAQLGADLIVCPTALMAPYDMVPRHIVPARAFENHLFVAYANRIGNEGSYRFPGQSRIVDPLGNILAAGGGDAGLVDAVLDPAARDASREDYDYLEDLVRLRRASQAE